MILILSGQLLMASSFVWRVEDYFEMQEKVSKPRLGKQGSQAMKANL
jgi:hypothetical protein